MQEYMLLMALVLSLAGNIWMLTGQAKLRGVLRTALRKAERDRCETVRIPYNQLAKEMGWVPEFEEYRNWKTKDTEYVRTSVYPMRENTPSGHTKHPATLPASKRGKL